LPEVLSPGVLAGSASPEQTSNVVPGYRVVVLAPYRIPWRNSTIQQALPSRFRAGNGSLGCSLLRHKERERHVSREEQGNKVWSRPGRDHLPVELLEGLISLFHTGENRLIWENQFDTVYDNRGGMSDSFQGGINLRDQP
jgi:hypothetical protein